jgi:ribosome biogenesis GTPase A
MGSSSEDVESLRKKKQALLVPIKKKRLMKEKANILDWREYFHSSNVGVFTVLVVAENFYPY